MSAAGGALKKQLPLFYLGLGGTLSNGRQWLSPISLRDHVRAVLWILDRSLGGPVNLVAPSPLTNRAFTKSLGRQMHRPTLARVPAAALRIALGSGLTDEAVLASQRAVPRVLTESGFEFESPEITSILSSSLSHRA
jgi:NAD dependent epimerase/dehydratase family enzyme